MRHGDAVALGWGRPPRPTLAVEPTLVRLCPFNLPDPAFCWPAVVGWASAITKTYWRKPFPRPSRSREPLRLNPPISELSCHWSVLPGRRARNSWTDGKTVSRWRSPPAAWRP